MLQAQKPIHRSPYRLYRRRQPYPEKYMFPVVFMVAPVVIQYVALAYPGSLASRILLVLWAVGCVLMVTISGLVLPFALRTGKKDQRQRVKRQGVFYVTRAIFIVFMLLAGLVKWALAGSWIFLLLIGQNSWMQSLRHAFGIVLLSGAVLSGNANLFLMSYLAFVGLTITGPSLEYLVRHKPTRNQFRKDLLAGCAVGGG